MAERDLDLCEHRRNDCSFLQRATRLYAYDKRSESKNTTFRRALTFSSGNTMPLKTAPGLYMARFKLS